MTFDVELGIITIIRWYVQAEQSENVILWPLWCYVTLPNSCLIRPRWESSERRIKPNYKLLQVELKAENSNLRETRWICWLWVAEISALFMFTNFTSQIFSKNAEIHQFEFKNKSSNSDCLHFRKLTKNRQNTERKSVKRKIPESWTLKPAYLRISDLQNSVVSSHWLNGKWNVPDRNSFYFLRPK